MDYESLQPKFEMVASLQSRKESLEAKLKEKNDELKALCVQEAELTGVLPPEIPLEAGESPPVFRRRVGTAFTYPENLINKLKSKEEESLATLELEYNIQSGMAEAARSLASDGTLSKCARRKHRLVYQQSQRRLLELEARLTLLRQACPNKQRKKPRPPLHSDQVDGVSTESLNGINLSPVQEQLQYSTQTNKQTNIQHPPVSRYNVPVPQRSSHRQTQCEVPYPSTWGHQNQSGPSQRHHHDHQGNRLKDWYNTAPSSRYLGVGVKPDEEEREKASRYRDRFGSLDRRRGGSSSDSVERSSPVHRPFSSPSHSVHPPPSVLLPNQTYPENSLVRSHSLDHGSRKAKEKNWYETSLDSNPRPTPPTPSPVNHPPAHPPHQPHPPHPPHPVTPTASEVDPSEQIHMPVTQQLSFDTVVPFESPKNHTVVQAGMWQPYREVTKPFEMADFYKYSTKFRKQSASTTSSVPQQKAVYQPLRPMTCQPLTPQELAAEEMAAHQESAQHPHDMLSWHQDQNTPQPRSATLV